MTLIMDCANVEVPVQNGRPRVLIVEDQSEICELLTNLLQPLGMHVFIASDGEQAVAQALLIRPHLITLDLNLPLKDGQSVLEDLADDPRTCDIPVIVVSAYVGDLRPTGQIVDVISKPFDVSEFIDAVSIAVTH